MSGVRIGKYHLPVWMVLVLMIGVGAMAISGTGVMIPGTDAELFEADVPRVETTAFTGTPVHFDRDDLITLDVSGNGAKAGASLITSQKLRIDMLMQIADPVTVKIPIINESEDSVIMLVRVTADSSMMLDVEEGFSTTGARLIETNQWVMTVDDNANADFDLEVVATEMGAFFLLVEIFAIG